MQPTFQRLTVELALALHDERTGGLERVFAPGSPTRAVVIRDILLTNVAGAALLRRQATAASATSHERAAALFTLLYKSITRGAYHDFVSDIATVSSGVSADSGYNFAGAGDPPLGLFASGRTSEYFSCPSLLNTATRLASDGAAPRARLCLAEFIRLNSLDDFLLDTQPPPDELGGTKSLFPGRPFSRLDTYQAIIAAPRVLPEDRAYALYRAVNCYAPSRNNGCGGKGVELSVRRAWFQRMHRDFPASRWAQALKYYW